MKLVVISSPSAVPNEANILINLFKEGVDYIHIRKPKTKTITVRELLTSIPIAYHCQIKLHYYDKLLIDFPLIGFHHSSKSKFNSNLQIKQSKSFHSFEEVTTNNYPYEYFFLSPVFPSISKTNYNPTYSIAEFEEFIKTHQQQNCIALGGINQQNIIQLQTIGFKGAALLGELWSETNADTIIEKFVLIKKQLTL
jgi:thiamine-phosphate pyrophosphorylase